MPERAQVVKNECLLETRSEAATAQATSSMPPLLDKFAHRSGPDDIPVSAPDVSSSNKNSIGSLEEVSLGYAHEELKRHTCWTE